MLAGLSYILPWVLVAYPNARQTACYLKPPDGRLAQGHWTLLYLGILGLILSWFNWKNNKTAYWLSAFIISAEDIGFLLFPVSQGGLQPPASAVGPALWFTGLIFTTLAYWCANDYRSFCSLNRIN